MLRASLYTHLSLCLIFLNCIQSSLSTQKSERERGTVKGRLFLFKYTHQTFFSRLKLTLFPSFYSLVLFFFTLWLIFSIPDPLHREWNNSYTFFCVLNGRITTHETKPQLLLIPSILIISLSSSKIFPSVLLIFYSIPSPLSFLIKEDGRWDEGKFSPLNGNII